MGNNYSLVSNKSLLTVHDDAIVRNHIIWCVGYSFFTKHTAIKTMFFQIE